MSLICEFAPGAGPFDVIGQHYLSLDGSADASTPDHASLDITGDIDIRAEATLTSWVPPTSLVLVSKWDAAAQLSFIFWMSGGRLAFNWSTNGTNQFGANASESVAIETGRLAVRVTLDVNNGSGGWTATFYTAPSLAGPWTQLGTAQSDAGVTSIFNGTSLARIGRSPTFSTSFDGRVHKAEILSGIAGSVVASPDFTAQSVGATSFSDAQGRTWTVNSPAAIAGFDWVDLSSRLLDASWNEGRDDELEHYGPGEATIVLKNDDRHLDPDHASGPYFGELLPRTPFRLRETAASPQDRFYGFVDSGFEQELHPPEKADCRVHLVDRLSAVAGLLPDVFEHALLSREPDGFWLLDAGSGTESVADASGNGHDGTLAGSVTFGEAPIAPGHGPSAKFEATATEFGRVEISRSPVLPDPSTVSMVATFRARSAGATNFRTLFIQRQGNLVGTGFDALLNTSGNLIFTWEINGGGNGYTVPGVVDGEGHILFAQSNGVALDATTLDTTAGSQSPPITNGVGIGGYQGIQAIDHWDGWIGAVAVFDRLLSAADRDVILEGYQKLSGLRTDEHIAWALDRLGVPVEHRNLDEGTVLMGPANTRGRDALEWIREVVATEGGEFYVDHRDGGKLRFRHRYARFVDARSTSAQAAFSDDGASGTAVRVERDGLDVAPNGIDGIVNEASVKWRDGEETVSDAASVGRYGPQGRSVTTQATTATQGRSAGEWLVARYAQPRSRVRGIVTRPDASANALTAARSLRVGDRVSYRSHPQQVGSAITLDLFVEGIDHSMTDGMHRTAVYRLAPVNTFTPWIWGTSEWDETKYWG